MTGTDPADRRRRTLQGKLTALVLSSVGLAVLLVTAASALKDGRREAQLEARRLTAEAEVLASMSAAAAEGGDQVGAARAVRAIAHMPGVVYGRIERADGAVLAENGRGARLLSDTDGVHGSWLGALSSRSTRTVVPIVRGGRPAGRVVLLSRGEAVWGRLGASLLTSLLAAGAATAAGLLIAFRLQRRIAAPVTALTGAMAKVQAHHDFAGEVRVEADDEVAELVTGFNRMLAEIRTRDAAIARHVEGLESEVAARTAELQVAKEAAEDANRAKGDFLAAMSHEIRTPMNGVMVMAEMLATSDLPAKPRRFAEVIAKSGAGLVAIINDILDVSKIEAGKLELERASVDVAELVEDVVSLFWDRAASKGLDLAAYVDPATPRLVAGDATRLRQVVTNLVNNAVKFTEAGGVIVEAEPARTDTLRFSVRDTGVGIAPDKIAGLFEAFTQADQSTTRRFGGTGLGLTICKRLVEAMGGEIVVTSTPGRGSCFAFDLPVEVLEPSDTRPPAAGGLRAEVRHPGVATRRALGRRLAAMGVAKAAPGDPDALVFGDADSLAGGCAGQGVCLAAYADPDAPALVADGRARALMLQPFRGAELDAILAQAARGEPVSSPQGPAETAAAQPTFSTARVLVADDSAVNREVAVEALARLGVAPTVVEDGRQAVEAVAAGRFDLVLMDGSMPVLDGYAAAREIRAMEADGRVPRTAVVALTAHVVGEAAQAWRGAEMDGVLHKPFALADLAAVLARHAAADAEPRPLALRSPADGEPPLLDPSALEQLSGLGGAAPAGFVERVNRLYAENAPLAAERLAEAAGAGDAAGCAAAVHALKSMSLNVGAAAVAVLAERLEERARSGLIPPPASRTELHDLVARTVAALGPGEGSADPEAALAGELAHALSRDALTLAYQPQYDRAGRDVVGVEALVRWTRPNGEPVDPERLARLAERHGLIGRLTDWVARTAMREMREFATLRVAVNGSAYDFSDPGFARRIGDALATTGFDPRRFEVEITETAVVSDEAAARSVVQALRDAGIDVALDDFGAGYSSLRYLRTFPFSKLKIDRQFITGCDASMQSGTIVHALISIGRALGMKVVAEGVESPAECEFLRSAGVHAFQGYLFSRPLPLEGLRELLAGQGDRRAA